MRTAVIGAGGWGTALSLLLAEGGHDVTIWARSVLRAEEISRTRRNERYLKGITIPPPVFITPDPEDLRNKDVYIFAVPSQSLREVSKKLCSAISSETALYVSASKGIERHTLLRMTEIIRDTLDVNDKQILSLSGPSHAEEVARKIPTVVVAAGSDPNASRIVQDLFSLPYFRVYSTTDVKGVELAGALKNVIAICAGILEGEGYGDNTIAALVTRGLAEMRRLGVALGAEGETFAGVAGLGDLIVTCLSKHSRNRFVGSELGKGKKLDAILAGMSMVAFSLSSVMSGSSGLITSPGLTRMSITST